MKKIFMISPVHLIVAANATNLLKFTKLVNLIIIVLIVLPNSWNSAKVNVSNILLKEIRIKEYLLTKNLKLILNSLQKILIKSNR